MERAGVIGFLKQQVRLRLCPIDCPASGRHPVYVADFVYCDSQGKTVVEDTTGMMTPVKRLKLHFLQAEHGIEVLIT
jgi:hypothetical protein